jgi:hypothetical protein
MASNACAVLAYQSSMEAKVQIMQTNRMISIADDDSVNETIAGLTKVMDFICSGLMKQV